MKKNKKFVLKEKDLPVLFEVLREMNYKKFISLKNRTFIVSDDYEWCYADNFIVGVEMDSNQFEKLLFELMKRGVKFPFHPNSKSIYRRAKARFQKIKNN